jgi:hypothetical protein
MTEFVRYFKRPYASNNIEPHKIETVKGYLASFHIPEDRRIPAADETHWRWYQAVGRYGKYSSRWEIRLQGQMD